MGIRKTNLEMLKEFFHMKNQTKHFKYLADSCEQIIILQVKNKAASNWFNRFISGISENDKYAMQKSRVCLKLKDLVEKHNKKLIKTELEKINSVLKEF